LTPRHRAQFDEIFRTDRLQMRGGMGGFGTPAIIGAQHRAAEV